MKNKIIVGIIVIVLIIVGVVWLVPGGNPVSNQEVSMSAPIDIVLDFYEPWLEARQSTSTDPYSEGLASASILSNELRKQISKAKGDIDTGIDPVLCQTTLPTGISVRPVFETEDKSEILVLASSKVFTEQAIVTLNKQNEGWYIDNIRCSAGEVAPDREFSFENTGYLLKDVPPPLNSQYWHLFFVENDELGVVPLFLDEQSVCISTNGDESTCDPSQFKETTEVTVYGELSESGATVKKLEFEK